MKTLVIDALCGIGFPTEEVAAQLAEIGYAEATAAGYSWRRDMLEDVDLENLQGLYLSLREERERLAQAPAEGERPNVLIADSLAAVDTSPPLSTDIHAALCDAAAKQVITQFNIAARRAMAEHGASPLVGLNGVPYAH